MKKISIITSTRAEYGLLKPLIQKINDDKELTLHLIVTGTHLLEEFGLTYKEIEQDFKIDEKIYMDMSRDDSLSLSLSMAKLQSDISSVFDKERPDMVVILGDRYEMLSVATAALMLHIPIAHIHGGEVTLGAIDDAIRHAITKMSYLHFASCEVYKNRIISMGEDESRVFNVGSLGVENVKNLKLLSKDEFEKSIEFKLGAKNLLVTYHPQTICELSPKEQFAELLGALDEFRDVKVIFTKANADEGGRVINEMIDEYVEVNKDRCVAFASLGVLRYFSAMRFVDAVVGNSSSGILEVPSFHMPTINIGDRQKGREMAESVFNVKILKDDIVKVINLVLEDNFKDRLKDIKSPYESDGTSQKILDSIKRFV